MTALTAAAATWKPVLQAVIRHRGKKRDGLGRNALTGAGKAKALFCGGLDVHLVFLDPEG